MKMTCAVDEITSLTAGEVKAVLDRDKAGQYLLVDVRQPEEYESGHIPGAIHIPLGELEARQAELDRNKKIITYCRSGHRSMAAAIMLCGLGFKGVHHLKGGILAWTFETITGIPERGPVVSKESADVRDIFMLAIKLEKGSRDFYIGAGNKVKHSNLQETFQFLADAEERHMRRLHERAESVLGESDLPSIDRFIGDPGVEYMEGGIEINPALARLDENISDDMEALEIALKNEFMSFDFYKRLAILVENPDARDLIHELARDERNHANALLRRVAETTRKG